MSDILAKHGNQETPQDIPDHSSMIVAVLKSDSATATTSMAATTISNQMQIFNKFNLLWCSGTGHY